jgi:tetratricopeptide (TPR) repeat protein
MNRVPRHPMVWCGLLPALILAGLSTSPAAGRQSAAGQAAAMPSASVPEGTWHVTLQLAEGGEYTVRLDAERTGTHTFRAYSRRGAAAELVGGVRAFAGRALGMMPPRGALARIDNGRVTPMPQHADSATVTGRFASPMFGSFDFSGALANGVLRGELHNAAGTLFATAHGVPGAPGRPVRDYAALATSIERTFAANLYDPQLVMRPEWRSFLAELHRRYARAADDAEAMAIFYTLAPRLRLSHINLLRDPVMAALPLDSLMGSSDATAELVTLSFPGPGVALLHVSRWAAVQDAVTRAFVSIDSAAAHTLIIDIRGNPGGDVSSMALLAHLVRDSLPAGVFLGRGWYAEQRGPPTPDQLRVAPAITSASSNALSVISGVREHGILRGTVPPLEPHFDGTVYLLIDGRSASASEPLAHSLRATGRATLVGRRTAGAMLSAPPHDIGDGWVLVLPEGDYYTADGVRLEGSGVAPDIDVASADATLAVAGLLRPRAPLAAAMLTAAAHTRASRWAHATHAYADALRADPWNETALLAAGQAYQELREWEQAFEAYDRLLRVQPANMSAAYQVGRTAALSGLHLERGAALLREYLRHTPAPAQPSHAAAHWRLGMVLELAGDHAAARREYERAVELDPANAEYRRALTR